MAKGDLKSFWATLPYSKVVQIDLVMDEKDPKVTSSFSATLPYTKVSQTDFIFGYFSLLKSSSN